MVAKILPLPEVVRSRLRSGVTITSVAQCVEELVLNSLDAGATCVAVRVDLSIFRIQVVDNGEGVPQTDLKYLGRRHATSKCHTLKDLSNHLSHYGFRGEALASTINLSAVVDITTHPRGSTQTFTKLFTYGKEKSVDTLKTNRPSIGTTITIQDFMYNMPVRRKLIREAIDLENIRMRLESFALMHPKVAFSLRNDRNGNMIIQTKKSSGTMATFMQLFGEERAQGLAEVHHSVNQFTVSGYIGTQPHLTKALQFVYVNRRVILRTKIHRMVSDLLARSSIISTRLHPSSVGPVKNPSSPPKGMKLYGIFVLNIECPYSEYDISLDPSKTLVEFKEWDQLLLCIEELILKFAREENLGISLDERYRRSGKEREEGEEEEEEISLSQGSHSCFQLFSLKRSCEDGEASGPAKQKYGHTLNTQDNLLAVHSLMVKRIRKDTNESKGPAGKKSSTNELDNNREVTEECNKDKKDGSDLPKKTDDTLLSTLRNKAKNYCEDSRDDGSRANRSPETLSKDTEDSYSQCVEGTLEETERNPVNVQDKHHFQFEEVSTKENSISEDKNFTGGSESDEVVLLATRKREGVRSVLEEFKKVLEEVNEKGNSTESNLDLALALTEKSTQQECRNRERVQQNYNNDTLSTLEEFMDFHNREQEKSIWDGFHTPEGDVMSTPASPPPLKSPHPSSPFPRAKNGVLTLEMLTERIEQSSPVSKSKRKCEFETRHRTSDFDYDEFAEKKGTEIQKSEHRSEKKTSLSKALSEKLKMHQNKSKTILSLHEKFGFSKTNAPQSKVETHSSLSNQPIRGGGSSSNVGDSSDVAPVECPRLNTYSAKHEGGGRGRMGDEICSNALGSIDCLQVIRHRAKCEGGSRVGSDKDSSVLEPMDCLQNTYTGKTEDMEGEEWADTSFRFKPVITRTFQEVDTCLSYVQPCRETVDMDLDLDNQVVVDIQCRGGEGRDQNPVVSSPLVHCSGRNVAGDDGEGDSVTIHSQYVTACSQSTTPPKKSNALLYIAESYASTPEDGDASPQKSNTPPRVPICLSLEDNLACPQSISLRNHQGGEQLNLGVIPASLNFTHDYMAYESRNITGEEDRLCNTVIEGEAPRLLNGSFHVNGSHSKFHCRRDCHKEISIACEKHYLNNSVEKGVNFKDLGNPFDLQTTSGSVPITQSFAVNNSETRQRSQSEEQEKKDDKYLHEDAHHLQASQGFTPPKAKPLGVHQQSASVGDESFVLDCSALTQKVTRSVEVLNSIVEPKELTREKTENQEPDSIMLIPLSQTSQEEIYLENTLSLPSQVIVENDPINYNDRQKPSLSEKMTLQTRSQPLSQGVVHSEEAEGSGKVTTGPEVMSAGQASPNPLSESLHFSQLTLPDDGATEPSHGISPSLDMLPAVLTDSISVPSSMSGGTGSESKVLPLWDTDFQVNHTENRNMNNNVCVDETKGLHSDAVTMADATETVHDSGDCQNVVLEHTLRLPSGLPPLTQSVDMTSRSFENSSKNLTLREKSSCQNTSEQMEMQIPPHDCKWREAVDKDGRTVYVNLQTGNSSYDPPEIKDTPEWTSSQPLGARLHRVPLTREPWYIPRGKAERERDSFTLSHGFKEFMSWKKTIEMRKRESANQAVSTKDSNSAEDGTTKTTASSMSQEVQEAIKTLLEDCEAEDDSVKWTEKPEACLRGPAEPLEVAQICQMWEPPDFAMDAEVLNSGPDAGAAPRSVAGVRVYNMVHPYRFSRDMLPSCKVLGQLDQKFIACTLKYSSPEGPPGKARQLVVLFDQHAVHERVRLESIIQENFETLASGESVLCTAAVSPPLELDLPEDEVRLMQAYSKKFNQRGLYFTKTNPSRVMFQLIPSCLVAREANELRHKRCQTAGAIVESVVRDLCHTLHQTGGVLGLIPHPITHVFNNNACRGAIKFGDELTREQCQDLISSLYSCQLPFQCAHGRPSIVPLVNLTQLASCPHKVSKPNLRRLREAMEAGTVL